MVLADGREFQYSAPELYVFAPGALHGWKDITEETVLSVCLVKTGGGATRETLAWEQPEADRSPMPGRARNIGGQVADMVTIRRRQQDLLPESAANCS